MLEKLLRQAAPASRAQANDLPSNNTYMYIMLARYIVVLFIVLSYYSHEIESKRENIREKTSRRVGVCQNTDRFRFEAKQPQRRNDLGFCQQYRWHREKLSIMDEISCREKEVGLGTGASCRHLFSTCCNRTHAQEILRSAYPFYQDQDPAFSSECKQLSVSLFCSPCDPFVGTGMQSGICEDLCDTWYSACRADLFTSYDQQLVPCSENSIICSPLSEMVASGREFCQRSGFSVVGLDAGGVTSHINSFLAKGDKPDSRKAVTAVQQILSDARADLDAEKVSSSSSSSSSSSVSTMTYMQPCFSNAAPFIPKAPSSSSSRYHKYGGRTFVDKALYTVRMYPFLSSLIALLLSVSLVLGVFKVHELIVQYRQPKLTPYQKLCQLRADRLAQKNAQRIEEEKDNEIGAVEESGEVKKKLWEGEEGEEGESDGDRGL